MNSSEEDKYNMFLDYKRGWLIGAFGNLSWAFGTLPPLFPEEFERGYQDGLEAFVTNMRKQFDRIQKLG